MFTYDVVLESFRCLLETSFLAVARYNRQVTRWNRRRTGSADSESFEEDRTEE